MESYRVIGLMSGTSLDGLDIALCNFTHEGGQWDYEILASETITYAAELESQLRDAASLSALDFSLLHVAFGDFMGRQVGIFLAKNGLDADLIGSHGHTIFHQPEKRLSVQIGSGAALLAACGIETVCDFRSVDVALGGQGAPLVPIGDQLLFKKYDFCLNLGGIANISFESDGIRRAYDVCPCNLVLNALSARMGFVYDEGGKIGASGSLHLGLLSALSEYAYYHLPIPKSLGLEHIEKDFFPLLARFDLPVQDVLRTLYEHIAMQIGIAVEQEQKSGSPSLFISGGGAFNNFLLSRIRQHSAAEIILPDAQTIQFKEALIFAFLGVLRKRHETNCLQSVTGSSQNHSGGCIYSL